MTPELHHAIEQLRSAIENEGNHPEYHRRMLDNLLEDWPTLLNAVDAILAAAS